MAQWSILVPENTGSNPVTGIFIKMCRPKWKRAIFYEKMKMIFEYECMRLILPN